MILPLTVPVARLPNSSGKQGGELGSLVRPGSMVYEGSPVPEDKRSVAFSITYRAHDRTLTDEEVNSVEQCGQTGSRGQAGRNLEIGVSAGREMQESAISWQTTLHDAT